MSEDTAICQLCADRADAEIPASDMGAHFRLFHPDTGVTEETIAQAEIVEIDDDVTFPDDDRPNGLDTWDF